MRRALALSVGVAATLAATGPALAADLEDPLTPLVSAAGSSLCFGRDYSPEHLAQHPKQMTKSVRLVFQRQLPRATIDLSLRTGEPHRIAADCIWWKGAGIDTSGRKMFPAFNKSDAFNCVVAAGSFDREGGALLIDPAQDARSLTLFVQDPVAAYNAKQGMAKSYYVTLGQEDHTFMLTRIDPSACAPFRR